ncbi:hypothetical protein [Streptomyces griseorubiginosus]|uniref:hypothetical protein n=1 Tax=Streptomyces griseorubiginosus TaxID=67304 RepID=UPI001AD79D4C|nr:hypothetical protein [Streptomyces griseorubiginosus]
MEDHSQAHGPTLKGNLALVAQGDLTMGGRTRPDGSVDYTDVDHTSANDLPGATLTPENPLAGVDQIARQASPAFRATSSSIPGSLRPRSWTRSPPR